LSGIDPRPASPGAAASEPLQTPRRLPLNRVTSEPLRRTELFLFCGLFLALCAAIAWRGVSHVLDGEAVFWVIGVRLPAPAGVAIGVFYLVLAAGIAAATLAMGIRFRR
jgi:hypothetical protein